MQKKNLALFDFDGTITNSDSFLLFVRKTVGIGRFCAGMTLMTPQISMFLINRYPNHCLKEDVLIRFFRNWPLDSFRKAADDFCRKSISTILRQEAWACLRRYQDQGDRVVIVSATPKLILAPWCEKHGLDLLATRLQVIDGRLTGRIEGENYRGQVKVTQILNRYRLSDYREIYAYGDTQGDRPMLALATHALYRPFRRG
jgi:HAD superfamily hydrolase (TIGR01490 family)